MLVRELRQQREDDSKAIEQQLFGLKNEIRDRDALIKQLEKRLVETKSEFQIKHNELGYAKRKHSVDLETIAMSRKTRIDLVSKFQKNLKFDFLAHEQVD